MKILHTGDLHIGQTLRKHNREAEHKALLDWLRQTIIEQEINLLLIAGDVFDSANPSIQSQKLFFEFLAELDQSTHLRDVVITAGNHDSAGRMGSWCPLTKKLGIHIIGATSNRSKEWLDWIIPIRDKDGKVHSAVVAVPYVSEYRLGIKWTSRNISEQAGLIKQAIRSVYDEMATEAKRLYGDVPLIGMGHLTAMDEQYELGDSPQLIHMIIKEGLDGKVFGDQFAYVALGHIHRKYKVRGDANAWFCGSPIPCSIAEAEDGSRRSVWLIELNDDPLQRPEPTPIYAPELRQLIRRSCRNSQLDEVLTTLQWSEDFPPFLYLQVETESASKTSQMIREIIDGLDDSPIIVDVKTQISKREISKDSEHEICDPDALADPMSLFRSFYSFKEGHVAEDEMEKRFQELLHSIDQQ